MDLFDICKKATAVLLSSESKWPGGNLSAFIDKPDYSLYQINSTAYLSDNNSNTRQIKQNPFDIIEQYQNEGYYAVGYIGYDYLEFTDIDLKLGLKPYYNDLPELYFNIYKSDKITCFDREQVQKLTDLSIRNNSQQAKNKVKYSISKKTYISNIDRIKKYIESGDVYQVNLSHQFKSGYKDNPKGVFINYFKSQPVPYGIYICCNKFHFLGGSMELFLEKKADLMTTRPIKGTSKRSEDCIVDSKIKSGLKNSTKERAENLMIVDLMRNDFSRICKNGTVKVNKLFDIKSYKTLHQMESEVSGRLIDDTQLKDIIYNIFPPGSVTGAPKKRAIEIIEELENHNRGPYCGCAGVFMPDGDFTLCVSIRTAILQEGAVNYWAGSGIVYDSLPDEEYKETLLKAEAFLKTIN